MTVTRDVIESYAFADFLGERLHDRKWPVPVSYYGAREVCDPGVLVKRAQGLDSAGVHKAQNSNPRRLAARGIGVETHIFGRSPKDGARPNEHEAFTSLLVDAVIVAAVDFATLARVGATFPVARPMTDDEKQQSNAAGDAYILGIVFSHSVLDRDYEGAGRLTGSPSKVTNTAEVDKA